MTFENKKEKVLKKLIEFGFFIKSEKINSLSHKWFKKNLNVGQGVFWKESSFHTGYYHFKNGDHHCYFDSLEQIENSNLYSCPIFTEKGFEEILKFENGVNEKNI